jgi:arylsulfatase A-like enzyme
MAKRPNILYITCHDLGDYLGCYGTPVSTPALDAMAEAGVLFENHFAADTVCSPTRASMLTGCYPHTHGLMGLVPRGWETDVDRCPPMPALLREAGYETHLFGLQHEHWDSHRLGYTHVHPVESNHADAVTPVCVDWLKSQAGAGQPFLASVGFFEPHRIGIASQGYREDLLDQSPSHFRRDAYESADPAAVAVRPYLLDTPELRQELADFYGAVSFMDAMVGRLLGALDEAGLAGDTLVIFATDHGASFLHAKGTLYDGGTKVAMLMRWPGELPAGHRVTALTGGVDLLPTLFEFLGLPCPAGVQGQSAAALARGQAGRAREYVYAERNYTQYFDPARMVRSGRFKYIRNGLKKCIFDFVITELELSPASFRNNDALFEFYSPRRCTEELYDLADDPAELNNVAEDPAYRETLDHMRARLDAHLAATDDPFGEMRCALPMPGHVYAAVKAHQRGAKEKEL